MRHHRRRFGGGGNYNPIGNAYSAMLFDVNRPTTMQFWGARSTTAAGSQFFSVQNSAFNFQQTSSQFMVSGWFRFDQDAFANGGYLFGVGLTGGQMSWYNVVTSAGNIQFWLGGAGGTFANVKTTSAKVFGTGSANWLRMWNHLVMFYDGSQTGDDTKVLRYYINGNTTPITIGAGTALPAKVGNSSGVPFMINNPSATPHSMSWMDVGICASVPALASQAQAVTDSWNNGAGVRKESWPASCPSLMEYWRGDSNSTASGTVPSGDEAGALGTYNLTQHGSPTGELVATSITCLITGTQLKFGYSPITGYTSRVSYGSYLPTSRAGKPGLRCYGNRASNGTSYTVSGCYGYAKFDGATLGTGGAMICNAIYNALNNGENDYFSFGDDETNLGASGCRRFLTMNQIGNPSNPNLDQTAGGRRTPNLHFHCATGNPLVYTFGPGDVNNLNGSETTGAYVGGNTYVQADGSTQYCVALRNKADGTTGASLTPGPFEIYVNGAKQATIFIEDPGLQAGQTWGASYPKLSYVALNGVADISTAGVWSMGSVADINFGPLLVLRKSPDAVFTAAQAWAAAH